MEEEGCLGHHPSTAGSGTALRDRDAVEKSECVCMDEKEKKKARLAMHDGYRPLVSA